MPRRDERPERACLVCIYPPTALINRVSFVLVYEMAVRYSKVL